MVCISSRICEYISQSFSTSNPLGCVACTSTWVAALFAIGLIIEHAWQDMWRFFVLCAFSPYSSKDVLHPTDESVSVVALNETGKVRVTWSRPTLGPGQVITGYSVQYRSKGTTSYTTRSVSDSRTTSYTITNFNLGTAYEVRVASVGPLGLSAYCCGSGKDVTTYNCECNVHC